MFTQKRSVDAFTGLEAAIVLIAFVVVAAVFSYVVLGAGFYTSQKSQETIYKGVEQATSNLQMLGQVYAISSANASNGIEKIKFSLGLAPGAPPVDLTKMSILYSNETAPPRLILPISGTSGAIYGFATTRSGTSVTTMSVQDQVELEFLIGTDSANTPGKNTKITVEIRPPIGASLSFSRTIPPYIYPVNIV
jgi:flagellin FlaB